MTTTVLPPALRVADCSRCQGLCCVAPAFDADQGFGHDKPAHQACHHLDAEFRCRIHERLDAEGYAGCAAYDCHGAGPQLLARCGATPWSALPDPAPLFDAFLQQRRLHEMLMLLDLALPQAAELAADLARLRERVEQAAAGAPADAAALRDELDALLPRLRALRERQAPPSPPGC